jgi:hypothetical protein
VILPAPDPITIAELMAERDVLKSLSIDVKTYVLKLEAERDALAAEALAHNIKMAEEVARLRVVMEKVAAETDELDTRNDLLAALEAP